jgi:hypothetical protein
MRGKFRLRRPSPAMIVAVVALVAALTGTAFAAKLGLGALSGKAKDKTVGVGKLTYVNVQQAYQGSDPIDGYKLTAPCPPGSTPLGGGTKLVSPAYNLSDYFLVTDYLSANGYTAQFFAGSTTVPDTVQVTVACGKSRAVTGAPPGA